MARPTKATVDYFPCDATFSSSIQCIENEFGNDGIVFWIKLLQAFCKHNFHYIDIRPSNTKRCLFYAKEIGMPVSVCEQILNRLAEYGSIDAELYKDGIIFSEHFVERIADVYKKRSIKPKTIEELKKSFCKKKGTETPVSGTETLVSGNNNPVNAAFYPQTKQNKTKLNEIKVEEGTTTPATDYSSSEDEISSYKQEMENWHGEYCNVHLTKNQYGKLLAEILSEEALKRIINQLSENIASKKEKALPFDENFPEMHFIACRNYWKFYRQNPQKFKKQTEVSETGSSQEQCWSAKEAFNFNQKMQQKLSDSAYDL